MSFELPRRRRNRKSPVVVARFESLENRRLLAGDPNLGFSLPYQLDFNRSKEGLLDRDGSGTGFTWALPNRDGTEFDTTKLDLRIGAGFLRLFSEGTPQDATNTLVNALTTRFAASGKPFVVAARVVGPIPQIDEAGEQGGILFGPDQDNYVKLVVTSAGSGQVGIQFQDEQRFKSGYKHTLSSAITNIGSATAIQTLDLYMSADADTGKVRALYSINGGAIIELSQQLTLTGDKKGAFFSNGGRAGLIASHGETGGIDFTYDQFLIKRGVLNGTVSSGNLSISSRKIFNDVRGGQGQTLGTSVKNSGNGPITITALNITGADSSQFGVEASKSLPITLAPGESLPLKIEFQAPNGTALNIKTATLTIQADGKSKTVRLRGLATAGTGGENEPSLQRVLDLYEIPVNVGDSNPSDVYIGDPPSTPNDEILAQSFVKVGAGPVIVQPLAVFGVSSNPALRLGWYGAGSPNDKSELLTVKTADAQTVNVVPDGATTFDPGAQDFGFYSIWPGFKNTDNTVRAIYSEDDFNTFDTHEARHIRVYPYKNPDGSTVPNAYVVAHEEFPGGYDVQDFVSIVYNVAPSNAGPEIGTENLDGYPAADRLVFNRFRQADPAFPSTTSHNQAKVRVRNSGTTALNISSIAATGTFSVLSSTGAQSVNPGKFVDVLVQFTGDSTSGVKTGTLTINSDDADEPAKVISLAGFNQTKPEANTEAPLATMLNNVFGYTTDFGGSDLSDGGRVEKVGDEVLSPYWFRANTLLPITVKQLTAFHTQGNTSALSYHNKGSNSVTQLFASAAEDAQTLFPRKSGALSQFAEASFTPGSTAIGWRVDGNEWSDPTKNVQEQSGGGWGHHLRFFRLENTKGQVVADSYILVMDFAGINYDYNDNTYLITNIRPESGGAALPQSIASAQFSGVKIAGADSATAPSTDELLDVPKDSLASL